jgi:hypothetical protein
MQQIFNYIFDKTHNPLCVSLLSFLSSARGPSEIAQRKREEGRPYEPLTENRLRICRARCTLTGFRGSLHNTAQIWSCTVRAGFLTSGTALTSLCRFTVTASRGIFTQIPLLMIAKDQSRSDCGALRRSADYTTAGAGLQERNESLRLRRGANHATLCAERRRTPL